MVDDPSPAAVHHLVCEFIAAQAEAEAEVSGGWTGYRNVFLTAEVQDLIRSRLPHDEPKGHADVGHADVAGDGPGSAKKRKLDDVPPAPVADDVSWTICCMDGATFSVTVPEHTQVAEVKRAIGTLREVPHFAFQLFVKGVEDPLDDEKRLSSANKVPLFMLPREISDRGALEAIFKTTGGTNWKNKACWNTDADLSEWDGVTVNVQGRVIGVKSNNNNLAGPAGPVQQSRFMRQAGLLLQQLSELQSLNLAFNALAGPIPVELGKLSGLVHLILGNSELSGRIPRELGHLAALETLHLENNKLSGPIPAELGALGVLQVLGLGGNQLSGPIPAALGRLSSLQRLLLDENELTGPIPAALGQLVRLTVLYLNNNQLQGPVPASLGQLTLLTKLYLSENELTGPVPAELGQLAVCTELYLFSNQVSERAAEEPLERSLKSR
jgi:hypothetical protein